MKTAPKLIGWRSEANRLAEELFPYHSNKAANELQRLDYPGIDKYLTRSSEGQVLERASREARREAVRKWLKDR
jgi:hypothetical protein